MIRIQGVSKVFHRPGEKPRRAVHELNLEVATGETLCLIGASGCGKTTTLRLINRLHDPTEGQVFVDGVSVAGLDPVQLRRRMGYVVQSGALFPHLSVGNNIGLLCRIAGWSKERIQARVRELLELVHLPPDEFGALYPGQLSGGQAQRVGVARALALDPEILLMDEPFGALDPLTRADLQNEFRQLDLLVAKTVVFVTHDMEEAFSLGDRVALMDEGRLQQIGTFEEFRDAPKTEQVRAFVQGHFHGA